MSTVLKRKNVLELGHNQIYELIEHHTQKVIENINDLDTDPTKPRTLTVKITFKGDEERKKIDMKSQVDCKLAPKAAHDVTLMNIRDENPSTGEVVHVLKELTDEIPGQMNLSGHITQQEVIIIGNYADRVIAAAQNAQKAINQTGNHKELAETAEGGL